MRRSPTDGTAAGGVDFFISSLSADGDWAEWIAWQLEDAGYSVLVRSWDFLAGSNIVAEPHRAAQRAARTIAVVSLAYLDSPQVAPEWQAALHAELSGSQRRLLLARVEDCQPAGLLAPLVPVDLIGVEAGLAAQRLLAAARGERGKPPTAPPFPGAGERRPEPAFPGRRTAVWNIPARLRFFTGRNELLDQIAERLARPDRAPDADADADAEGGRPAGAVALYGLGGVGKTQLAVEHAHRSAGDHRVAWWIDAEQPTLIGGQLATLAARLGLPVSGQVADDAAALLDWLGATGDWLMVFDNARDVDEVRAWLPDTGRGGRVLITSRSPVWTPLATRIQVDVLGRAETATLLRRLVPDIDESTADALAEQLGDLPLAAGQAAAYLETTGQTPVDYLADFRARRDRLLAEGQDLIYGGSVDTAWSLSLRRLAARCPPAVRLLGLAAFLGPEPIPLTLFVQPATRGRRRRAGLTDEQVAQATTALLGYSLITRDGPVLRVHRLVQQVTRARMTRDQRLEHAGATRRLLVAAAPAGTEDPDAWPVWTALAPHALTAPALHPTDPAEDIGAPARRLLLETGWYLRVRGDPQAAHRHHRDLRHRWAGDLGAVHADTLAAANNLAEDLRALGNFAAARTLDEDTLRWRRSRLGHDHPDTLASANNLALDLRESGEVAAARALDEDTLRRRRALFGDDDPDTLRSASNLAIVLRESGEVAAARALDEDTLRRRRALFGDDHPDTLASANNVALDLRESGEVAAARALDEDTLRRHRQLFGEDHPATLRSLSNLAADLTELGDLAGAARLRAQVDALADAAASG